MISKLLLYSTLPIAIIGGQVSTIINENKITKNNDYTIIDKSIYEDIYNYNDVNDLTLDSSITFKQSTIKQLFVLRTQVYFYKWYTFKDYKFTNKINIDLTNEKITCKIFPDNFSYTFKDPDPKWCDPVGAKWNDKTRTITVSGEKEISASMTKIPKWYGNEIHSTLKYNGSSYQDDGWLFGYPDHNYITHSIRVYINGWYKKNSFEKEFILKEITNKNILKVFMAINKPIYSNNGLVWNNNSIKKHHNIFSFSTHFRALKIIHYANMLIDKLLKFKEENTINNIWTHKWISQSCIDYNLNALNNLGYSNFNQLLSLDKSIFTNEQEYYISGNFSDEFINLENTFKHHQIIDINDKLNKNDMSDLYETIILFFRNNDIYINFKANDEKMKLLIWDGSNFTPFLEQIKTKDTNILNVEFESMDVIYKKENQSLEINNDQHIDKNTYGYDWFKNNSFKMMYRYNALNIDVQMKNDLISQTGIILNLNKHASSIVGTGINKNGYIENKFINNVGDKIKTELNNFFQQNIVADVYDVSLDNKEYLSTILDNQSLQECARECKIGFNEWFDYCANNYYGIFYSIIRIDNWQFSDGTDGDFAPMFKQRFEQEINKDAINIKRIKTKQDVNSAYFLCKLRTNKLVFNYYNNRPIIEIDNIDEIKQNIEDWKLFICDSNNWKKDIKNKEYHDMVYQNKIRKVNYENDRWNEKFVIKIKINTKSFATPYKNQINQFKEDILNNPLLNHYKDKLNINPKISTIDDFGYISSTNDKTLNITTSLYEFNQYFYNDHINNLIDSINKQKQRWNDEINLVESKEYYHKKIWSPFPIIVLCVGSFTLLCIFITIVAYYKKKQIKNI